MSTLPLRLLLPALLWSGACAHGAPWDRVDDPPLQISVVVKGLKPHERALLKDELCSLPRVEDCALEEKKNEARYSFRYRGSLGQLRGQIARFPHPGLTPASATVALAYDGFDNLAPTIELQGPKPGEVLTDRTAIVVVRVADPDTAAVAIAGQATRPLGEGRYSARVELAEGDNRVAVVAVDEAGNEAALEVPIRVDTTPPELEVQVAPQQFDRSLVTGKLKGKGRVLVDGKEVPVDLFGAFQIEMAVDPDKRTVEVKAVDEHGNTRVLRRSLTRPSGPSGESE